MFPKVDSTAWLLVCEGELGDLSYWQPGFKVFENVAATLDGLEEVQGEIDWAELIGKHQYFSELPDFEFPPLYNPDQFEQIFSEFLCVCDDDPPEYGPGRSFTPFRLYLDTDHKERVLNEFESFLSHLQSLPIVRRINDG